MCEERDVVFIFAIDIIEVENKNVVCIIGRDGTSTYRSCCIVVEENDIVLYAIPKPDFSTRDVFQEISEKAHSLGFGIRGKPKKKNYAFGDHDIPFGLSEVVKLRCLRKDSQNLLGNVNSGHTFSKLISAHRSLSEALILSLRLKGPRWLIVAKPILVHEANVSFYYYYYFIHSFIFLHLKKKRKYLGVN